MTKCWICRENEAAHECRDCGEDICEWCMIKGSGIGCICVDCYDERTKYGVDEE